MEPKRLRQNKRPEDALKSEWVIFLEARGWLVKTTHGGMFQEGFPDLWITHRKYGGKWVEIKLPNMKGSRFTKAQKRDFPLLIENGTPIWILTTVCEEEYRKLFEPCNLLEYFLLYHW